MKRFSFILKIFLLTLILSSSLYAKVDRREVGNLVIEGIPEIPEALKERMQQYLNTRSAGFAGWDAEGRGMYLITRFGETSQAHYVEKPGGMRRQLTFFDEPVSGLSVRPLKDKPGFLFSKDVGGSEKYQIFYYDMRDGSYEMLTDGKSRNGSTVWSNDGYKFAYMSNKRNGRDFDVYIAEMSNAKNPEMVYEGKGYWIPIEWSPDNKKLILANYISINESSLYIFDILSKKLTPLLDVEEKVSVGGGIFAGDGKGIYYTTDYKSEFKKLHYYDIADGKSELLTPDMSWDIEGMILNDNGNTLAFTVNESGQHNLYMMDTKTRNYSQVKSIPTGLISGGEFGPDNKSLALTINSSKTPGDVFVYNTEYKNLTRWTESEVGGLNTENFVLPTLIEYPTFDKENGKQRMIPAFYYKPKGKGPFPVVLYFHGGPEGQFQPGFISTFQFWLNELGIAVIAPNVRGSSGYGKSYLKLDNGFLRENSVKDGGSLLDWVAKRPELDAGKVAVFGGSYGGYMVLAMMTHYNDRLAGGVDIVGISNFVTFLKNTGDYRRDLRRVEYGDERDEKMRKFLEKISPTNNADKITKPLFIAQGLNDPRVPASEAEQILEAIRNNDGDAWYFLAKDEGHGFRKKSNRDYFTYATALFFKTFLK